MTRFCTIPDIGNLRKWFEKNFHNPCAYHDDLYAEGTISRLKCDLLLVQHMRKAVKSKGKWSKRLIYYPAIFLTFLIVRLLGWLHYDYTFWDY